MPCGRPALHGDLALLEALSHTVAQAKLELVMESIEKTKEEKIAG